VAEFNRYSRVPIRISDAGLVHIRIGGSFQTRNADAFLDLLETAYGLHVERRPTEVELRR
jgi:transmembrane sensor